MGLNGFLGELGKFTNLPLPSEPMLDEDSSIDADVEIVVE